MQIEIDELKMSLVNSEKAAAEAEAELTRVASISLPPSASASQDTSAQENLKLFNAVQTAKDQTAKNSEALSAQLGAKDAELSKLMAASRDFEERAVRAEQILTSSLNRENQACGDEDAMTKRNGTLQTQLDLVTSAKESLDIKYKSLEVELRDLRATASVSDDKLNTELEACHKTIKKLQESRGEVGSMGDAIKALETRYE